MVCNLSNFSGTNMEQCHLSSTAKVLSELCFYCEVLWQTRKSGPEMIKYVWQWLPSSMSQFLSTNDHWKTDKVTKEHDYKAVILKLCGWLALKLKEGSKYNTVIVVYKQFTLVSVPCQSIFLGHPAPSLWSLTFKHQWIDLLLRDNRGHMTRNLIWPE